MLHRGTLTIGVSLARGLAAVVRGLVPPGSTANAHYKALIEQATDGILLVGREDGRVLYMNAALAERLGKPAEHAAKLSLRDIIAEDDVTLAALVGKFAGGSDAPVRLRQRALAQGCIDVEVRLQALEVAGRTAYAFIMRDVSVRNKVEQQLMENQQRLDRMAHHDQLTGLPNRHYLHAFLPEAIDNARTTETMLGVVFLDLDRFKHINDTRGHETGDKLLQEVARRVRACVRNSDVVIRMGGDEFVIVLRNVKNYDEISHGAGRIVATLNKPILVDGHPLQTTASVGVSIFPRDGTNMMDLLKHSDTAMYQAKDRGRNNVQIFSAIMNRKLEHRVAVEAALREALRLKQLDVHYQPFVNLRSRKIVGLEALVRWRHPVEGMIPPDRFIPIAEETGLVVPIGNFVLHRTLQNMSAWKRAGAPLVPVSLNVSPAQLQRGELRSLIATLLATYGLPAELLQLELTERAVFDLSVPQAGENRRDSIAQVRDLGVKIAIDDFGTGYSSLSYLKHWQVDSLKIDKSFVRDLATDTSDLAIVSAIIAIAKHLRIEVVGEGIEGYQQAEILRNLGCHLGQGFLFARPVPAGECVALLAPQQTGVRVDLEEEEQDLLAALKIASR
jgi:diguanylate cyclase (GGDEF)-like protein/PAS domain S-box-containing protein